MAVSIQADTPLAAQLSAIVQPKLIEIGWSTGVPDDSALAEYIILMLINGKSQEQIASELSNDLLSLGPEDSGATDFATWLFEQVNLLTNPNAAAPQQELVASETTQAIPSFTSDSRDERNSAAVGQEVEMGEATDSVTDTSIPTGPKSMRNNAGKPSGKRLVGQLNRAMDRSNDSVLHRVRPQGQERVNSHGRQPPKGPRANAGPNRFGQGAPMGGPAGGRGGGRGHQGGMQNGLNMSTQQQAQLLQFMEQQAKIMNQILTPQQQQMMGGMPAPAINPNFRPNQPQGKSLFERIQKPNGHHHNRQQINNNGFHARKQDTEMGDDTSMDVESSELGPETRCKFDLKCTKSDCIFAHQSSAAPPGVTVDPSDHCPFGAACQNRKCVARHPSPAQKKAHQSEQDCKFFPNCTNPHCAFRHPSAPPCRFGSDCTREDCKFTHVQTKCKFNPCLNPGCVFKHEEGQKRGKFGDKVWTAEGKEGGHVSERKFVATVEGEELIIPGAEGGSEGSHAAEVIT